MAKSPTPPDAIALLKADHRKVEGLFARAKAADLDLAALGERLAVRKQELTAEVKLSGLPDPQTRSFTGHSLVQGAPVG